MGCGGSDYAGQTETRGTWTLGRFLAIWGLEPNPNMSWL